MTQEANPLHVLADKLETAKGNDRALFIEAFNTMPDFEANFVEFLNMLDAGAYVDAAMQLVPEGWSVKLYIHTSEKPETYCDVYLLDMADNTPDRAILQVWEAVAPTPALALAAACCRAHAALTPEEPTDHCGWVGGE